MRLNLLLPGVRWPHRSGTAAPSFLSCPAAADGPAAADQVVVSSSDAPAVDLHPDWLPRDASVEVRLQAAIEEVRPAIRMDGGDIQLVSFCEGVVTVRLMGACRSCPMSEMTLQLGVERTLRQLIPEVERVEAI